MAKKTRKYVIVRTYSAGCFAGHLAKREGKEVELNECRRLWSWRGAKTLSELAVVGTADPKNCRFSVPTPTHLVTEAIEVIDATAGGEASIKGVPEWKN